MQHFGVGFISAVPLGVANPTPVPFGLLKDITLDSKVTKVKERGQYSHPVAVGTAAIDTGGKVGTVSIFGAALGQLYHVTPTTGSLLPVVNEPWVIPATPFQVTVTNGATFAGDYGVLDYTAGIYMTRGATASGTGVYAVNTATGVYTFHTADSGHNIGITYTYTAASAGKTIAITQTTMQLDTSGFQMVAYGPSQSGKAFGVKFYNVFFEGVSFSLKPEAFTAQNVSYFIAQDTTSQKIMDWYTGE